MNISRFTKIELLVKFREEYNFVVYFVLFGISKRNKPFMLLIY